MVVGGESRDPDDVRPSNIFEMHVTLRNVSADDDEATTSHKIYDS